MEVHVIRLVPGDDLQKKLIEFVKEKKLGNAFILTCVGSLTKAHISLRSKKCTEWIEINYTILYPKTYLLVQIHPLSFAMDIISFSIVIMIFHGEWRVQQLVRKKMKAKFMKVWKRYQRLKYKYIE